MTTMTRKRTKEGYYAAGIYSESFGRVVTFECCATSEDAARRILRARLRTDESIEWVSRLDAAHIPTA